METILERQENTNNPSLPFESVKEHFDGLESYKREVHGCGQEFPKSFDRLYFSWEQSFIPISEIGDYQLGISVSNGTYEEWKNSGHLFTPKLVVEDYENLKSVAFKNWINRSSTTGLGWLEGKIMESKCPPLVISDQRIISSGDFIDGQHRAYIFYKLFGKEAPFSNVPVIIGHMSKEMSYMYNSYLLIKMNIPVEDKIKLFRQRFCNNIY